MADKMKKIFMKKLMEDGEIDLFEEIEVQMERNVETKTIKPMPSSSPREDQNAIDLLRMYDDDNSDDGDSDDDENVLECGEILALDAGIEQDTCLEGSQCDPLAQDMSEVFNTEKVFKTREELVQWCKDAGARLNVVLITKWSASDIYKPGRIYLACERSGQYRKRAYPIKTDSVKRSSGTKKCDCPFLLYGHQIAAWSWKLEVKCGFHNHLMVNDVTGHAYAARLVEEEKILLRELVLSGVSPRDVLVLLKNRNPESKVTIHTIYNAVKRMRLGLYQGRTMLQQLMKTLSENAYVFSVDRVEMTQELRQIFWAHPESILYARSFPYLVLVDCTYKINKYSYPLCHMVGITSIGKSFSLAFAFLTGEKQQNYEWALSELKGLYDPLDLPQVFVTDRELALMNAIHVVFPRATGLLCTFHITKNIDAHCAKKFPTKKELSKFQCGWKAVIESAIEADFDALWIEFKKTWAEYPECIEYIEETWIPRRESFAHAWTNKVRHFGTTTNRVEGQHARLKIHLSSCKGHFGLVFSQMHNMLTLMFTELKASFQYSLTTRYHKNKDHIFSQLVHRVSHFALNKIDGELNASYDNVDCNHVMQMVYGLPCAHELKQYRLQAMPIPLSSIHPFWKRLTAIPKMSDLKDVELAQEIELITRKYEQMTELERKSILDKLKEVHTPETTMLTKPKLAPTLRGRPKGSRNFRRESKNTTEEEDNSTRRSPSRHEHVFTSLAGTSSEIGVGSTELSGGKVSSQVSRAKPPKGPKRKYTKRSTSNEGLQPSTVSSISSSKDNIDVDDDSISVPKKTKLLEDIPPVASVHDVDDSISIPKQQMVVQDFHLKHPIAGSSLTSILNSSIKAEMFHQEAQLNVKDRYIHLLPVHMKPYIRAIYDVPADGHCGFHAIALALRETKILDWKTVRMDLKEEMQNRCHSYIEMFSQSIFQKDIVALNCFTIPCPSSFWMSMPVHGYAIANRYQVAFVLLSNDMSLTFLPLCGTPDVEMPHKVICLALLNRSHFVVVDLVNELTDPLPPVDSLWERYHLPEAEDWILPFKGQFDNYRKLVPKSFGIQYELL